MQLHLLVYGPEAPKQLVIYVHGNCEDIYRIDGFVGRCQEQLFAPQSALVTFDWPGYGQVAGKASEKSLVETAQQVLYFCKRRFSLQIGQISLWGRSIGTVAALAIAASNYVSRVLLESPISSAFDAVSTSLPQFMNSFRNCEYIRHFKGESLAIVGGDQDETLDFRRNACKLFRIRTENALDDAKTQPQIEFSSVEQVPGIQVASAPRTTLYRISGGHHNDLGQYFRAELEFVIRAVFGP